MSIFQENFYHYPESINSKDFLAQRYYYVGYRLVPQPLKKEFTTPHKKFELAKAWHDHGHENNPKFPRWEDTRKSSGFNFRMTEMQSAIGRYQLKKLKEWNKNLMEIFNKTQVI